VALAWGIRSSHGPNSLFSIRDSRAVCNRTEQLALV
jgi:hypothetical protein